MCQVGIVVAAFFMLVGDQCVCDGNSTEIIVETQTTQEAATSTDTQIFPRSLANAESTEEQQGYSNTHYAPSTVNFHDIYSNTLALLAVDDHGVTSKDEDPLLLAMKDDDAFHLNLNTQFVEFHPRTVPPSTIPPPLYLLNSSYIRTEGNGSKPMKSMNEDPDDVNVEVIPIKKPVYQRGLLDLLFPAARVKTFKSVFDTFRRLMSHTFR